MPRTQRSRKEGTIFFFFNEDFISRTTLHAGCVFCFCLLLDHQQFSFRFVPCINFHPEWSFPRKWSPSPRDTLLGRRCINSGQSAGKNGRCPSFSRCIRARPYASLKSIAGPETFALVALGLQSATSVPILRPCPVLKIKLLFFGRQRDREREREEELVGASKRALHESVFSLCRCCFRCVRGADTRTKNVAHQRPYKRTPMAIN